MIRRALESDINTILELLGEVNLVHHLGRPDIFKRATKYTNDELVKIINDDTNPIFVYVDDKSVLGYIFLQTIKHENDNILTDIKTLYVDDLCVSKNKRGSGIGKALYLYAKKYAKENGYYNVCLNVWNFNKDAYEFYMSLGLKPLKTYLEEKI